MYDNARLRPATLASCKAPISLPNTGMLRSLAVALTQATVILTGLSLLSPALAEEPCQTVQFKPGASSAVITGSVDPEEIVCYRFTTGKGQRVSMSIKSKNVNTVFSILDLQDAVTDYKFKSQKKTYTFYVGQLMKAADADTYKLTLSIK